MSGHAFMWGADPVGVQVRVPVEYFILSSAAIGVVLIWARRKKCVTLGCCAKCGYDLRASKERCPECGTPIPLDKTRDRPPPKDLKPPETDPPAGPLPPA
jgi:hypothetical protein